MRHLGADRPSGRAFAASTLGVLAGRLGLRRWAVVGPLGVLTALTPLVAGADGGNPNLVHACVNRWTQVRIVGPSDACDPGERSLHWALVGPDGVAQQGGGAGGACGPGMVACGGAGCVNVVTDVRNCGACGHVCSSVNASGVACVNGMCQIAACQPPFADCNRNPADGCETNVATDVRNCGACGRVCAAGQACVSGTCR